MLGKYGQKLKDHLSEVLKIKTSPKSIASGFAIGVFFGIFPTFGLELIIIPLTILFFKKISKISLGIAYILFNPLITFPIHILSYFIGDKLLSNFPVVLVRWEFLGNVLTYTRRFILGSFIIAVILSLISYFVVLFLSKKYQSKNKV